MGRMKRDYVTTSVLAEPEVMEFLKNRGYNISELFRQLSRMTVESLAGVVSEDEDEGVKELVEAISSLEASLNENETEHSEMLEDIELRKEEMMRLKVQNMVVALPRTKISKREVVLKGREVKKEEMRLVFKEHLEKLEGLPNTNAVWKNVNGKWKDEVFEDFWMKHYKDRNECGLFEMEDAIEWLHGAVNEDEFS